MTIYSLTIQTHVLVHIFPNRSISSLSYCEVGTHIIGRHAPLTLNDCFRFLCKRGDIRKGCGRDMKYETHYCFSVVQPLWASVFAGKKWGLAADSATEQGLWWTQQEVISSAHVGHWPVCGAEKEEESMFTDLHVKHYSDWICGCIFVCVCVCVCLVTPVMSNFAIPWTSLLGSSVHGILPGRKLEWVAMPSSRGSDQGIKPVSPALQENSLLLSHGETQYIHQFSSVQLLSHVRSLRPHESQHARPPCPSPSPGVHSDSCPSRQWCHPAISYIYMYISFLFIFSWLSNASWGD